MMSNSILGLPSWATGKSENEITTILQTSIRRRCNPPVGLEHLFVKWGSRFGICPDVLAAISMLETDWWNFSGNVTPDMNNPAGIRCKCDEGSPDCKPGKNGTTYRTYPSLEVGIAHFSAHLYCYTHAEDRAGAKRYDPCWATWYASMLQQATQYGLAPDSIDACYSMWRDGVLPPTAKGLEAIASIKRMLAEFEKDANNMPNTPSSSSIPSWLLPVGLGVIGIAAILSRQGGQRNGK